MKSNDKNQLDEGIHSKHIPNLLCVGSFFWYELLLGRACYSLHGFQVGWELHTEQDLHLDWRRLPQSQGGNSLHRDTSSFQQCSGASDLCSMVRGLSKCCCLRMAFDVWPFQFRFLPLVFILYQTGGLVCAFGFLDLGAAACSHCYSYGLHYLIVNIILWRIIGLPYWNIDWETWSLSAIPLHCACLSSEHWTDPWKFKFTVIILSLIWNNGPLYLPCFQEIKTVDLLKPVGWVHISLSGTDPRYGFCNLNPVMPLFSFL